jgi:hypothetical protein
VQKFLCTFLWPFLLHCFSFAVVILFPPFCFRVDNSICCNCKTWVFSFLVLGFVPFGAHNTCLPC